MDIQPILNKVLDAGLYKVGRELYMCHALRTARKVGLITPDEEVGARRQIQEYISSINPVAECLANCFSSDGRPWRRGLPGEPVRSLEDFVSGQGLAIFKDWANRPMPE